MKNLLLALITIFILSSCKKEEPIKPTQPTQTVNPDTLDDYTYMGVLNGVSFDSVSTLAGQKWVIKKWKKNCYGGYNNVSDTLYFTTNKNYEIHYPNGLQSFRKEYRLYTSNGKYTLVLLSLTTINGLHLSCNDIGISGLTEGTVLSDLTFTDMFSESENSCDKDYIVDLIKVE